MFGIGVKKKKNNLDTRNIVARGSRDGPVKNEHDGEKLRKHLRTDSLILAFRGAARDIILRGISYIISA